MRVSNIYKSRQKKAVGWYHTYLSESSLFDSFGEHELLNLSIGPIGVRFGPTKYLPR